MSIPDTSIHYPSRNMENSQAPYNCHTLPSCHLQIFIVAADFNCFAPLVGDDSMPDSACSALVTPNRTMAPLPPSAFTNCAAHSSPTYIMVDFPIWLVGGCPMWNSPCSTSPASDLPLTNPRHSICSPYFLTTSPNGPSHTPQCKCW